MDEGESALRQEDCNEDTIGVGILVLTSKRIAFDKTKSRIIDFTKRFSDTVIDVALTDIIKVWKEGWIIKKVCVTVNVLDKEETYKFGVFSTGGWVKSIKLAIKNYK